MPLTNLAAQYQAGYRLKFGCHDFLNSQPIVYPIKEGLVDTPFETVFAPPGDLADMLKDGALDLAFIPAVEYARIHGLRIVPGFSIAALGPVQTVLLFSKHRIEEIDTVAVDHRSRTSVSLLRVLMAEFYKKEVEFAITRDVHGFLDAAEDATLVIGDESFRDAHGRHVYDLSELWHRFTGLPFVFAVLCVAPGCEAHAAVAALRRAKEVGMGVLDEICRASAARAGITVGECRDYLMNRIRYDLTDADVKGLRLFLELAHKHQVVHAFAPVAFYPG
ncbi:MAG: menaquinone biosynthesis protein [Nitrospinae bacterium]|nr:menaquinone biosynthesis protein [Nitrospinota bacterium]